MQNQDKTKNTTVKAGVMRLDIRIPAPSISTAPASKFLIGTEIEDIRDRVSLSPSILAETLDTVYTTTAKVSKMLIQGVQRNVYTYKAKDGLEASFVSLSDTDIPDILRTAKEIADYADKNGTMEKTEKGFMVEVEINDYLKHLGYTPTADGSYKTQDRRKVWHDLKKVFNTPVKRAVNFKSGTITKTAVFEAPIIQLAEVYDGSNTKQVIAYSLDNINPPQSFLIGIVSEVAKQMTGFRDGGLYFHKSLVIEPRSKASDYKYDLQGFKLAVRERLFYLLKLSVQPTRRYAVKDLTEVISGRDKDKRKKLIEALEVLEKRGDIKKWGFANSRNKSYNKTEKKSTLVWVDHADTDVYRKYQDFYKGDKSDTAKLREEVKRLKKEQRQHDKEIKKIKKDL